MTYFNLKYPWTGCGPLANPGEAHFNGVFQHAPVETFNASQSSSVVQESGCGGTNFLKEIAGFNPYINYLFSHIPFFREKQQNLCPNIHSLC